MTRTSSLSNRPAIDPAHFRRTMGRFTSGVTVITTVDEGRVHGMTANAFLSVSIDPPLVLISLARESRMAALLPTTGRYGVNVLAEHQRTHSQHFAGRPVPGLAPEFQFTDEHAFLPGSMAQIGCDLVSTHEAGDHVLHIGHVTHLAHSDGEPLVFFTGAYRALYSSDGDDYRAP
ncbi:flavin reductase family protein [Saccharomonospora sp. NPDC006951]